MTKNQQTSGALTKKWTVGDILIAAVLSIVCGLVFSLYNGPGGAIYNVLDAVTPGLGGLGIGPWLFAGPLVMLAIRKPGAAVFGEFVAALVSFSIGSQWGVGVLYSGLAQGIGAEIAFAIFAYKLFDLKVSAIAGALAAVGAWANELITSGNIHKSLAFNVTYLVSLVIGGAIVAGLLAYFIVVGLSRTGALDKVAAGRHATQRV